MNELLNNMKAAWAGWSRGRRTLFVAVAAGVVVLTIIASAWALSSSYQVLFADLDPRDAAAIVDELKRMKVHYQIADGGSKILVDEKTVHETRLRLMGRGVPLAGGVGFEIFDNKDVGMTEYTQKINYQRALQGELARTISSMNEVRQARVQLVIGESTLFKRQKIKPKASVSLALKPGAQLATEQILGIQRLVAASVPGLEPGAVTIVDQRGVTLSAAMEEDEDYQQISGKLRLKKNAEDYFIRKISAVLDRTFGPGQAIVSVDVTFNFDDVKRTQQTVVPVRTNAGEEAGAVVRKRQSVYRARGPVAKVADGDTYAAASPDLSSTTDVEYELGKTIEQVVSSPGSIRRVSVGIVVPKVSAEQTQRVQDLVSMIVGFNGERGDAISVQSIDRMMAMPEPDAGSVDSSTATAATRAPATAAERMWIDSRTTRAALLSLAAMLIGVAFVTWWRRRGPRRAGPVLSFAEQQRYAQLAEIKAWLEAERARGQA